MDCFDNDLDNNFENNAWKLKHDAEELQEILNRIMQGIVSIIISALIYMYMCLVAITIYGIYVQYTRAVFLNNNLAIAECIIIFCSKLKLYIARRL